MTKTKTTKTTNQFIEDAKKIHGEKYNYSLVEYIGSNNKVKIICPIHGVFEQRPSNHLTGYNCNKCNKSYKLTTEDFINKSKEIHGELYDYSLTKYINNRNKVKIICPVHGEFEQLAANHIIGRGCVKCQISNNTTTKNEFILKANIVHHNKYDYYLVNYKNNETKIKIICPIHGVFEQIPNNHISQKQGCPICKDSTGEKKISYILKNMNIIFKKEYKFKKCKNKRELPFDFYLPDYNICIEFDGKQHFEVNEFFGGIINFNKLVKNDNIKNEYCKNNNIRLIRIRYDEDINIALDKLFL